MTVQLTAEQIQSNYKSLIEFIETTFPNRPGLLKLYTDLKERLLFSPASAYDYFHNTFPGGYTEHVLRVIKYAKIQYNLYDKLGLDVSNFTLEELLFAALNHDLGKLGFPGDKLEGYKENPSDWHRKNQGKLYEMNANIPYARVPDLSVYLLNHYGVKISWNEMQGILIHDGLYDDSNKNYYTGFKPQNKLRSNLAFILHTADMMASRFEFERWNKSSQSEKNSINTNPLNLWDGISEVKFEDPTPAKKKTLTDQFSDVFED